jgi:predicted metal-dependent hydrolase
MLWFRKLPRATKRHYQKHKEFARALVKARLLHFNQFYNFEYNTVSIKNMKTRWGSCSSKRNLNFNYKILFLKPEEQDYIIVHELCHLKELNHGPHFWELVAQQSPNWRTIRSTLRKGIL